MNTLNDEEIRSWNYKYYIYTVKNRQAGSISPTIEDIKGNTDLTKRMQRVALVYDNCKDQIKLRYGLIINIISCWEFWANYHDENILFKSEKDLVSCIVTYAIHRKQALTDIIDLAELKNVNELESKIELGLPVQEIFSDKLKQPLKSQDFDDLFSDEEKRKRVIEVMRHLDIINSEEVGILPDKYKGKIAGLIDALIKHELIPDYPLTSLGKIFCLRLGLDYTRLKNDTIRSASTATKADKYLSKFKKN